MGRAVACILSLLIACGAAGVVRAADTGPAFPLRGFKGLWWDGLDKYRKAVPWAAEHHLNFVMLCYTSFAASGKDWRADYAPDELAGMKDLAAHADKLGVELCLSFNPGIWSKPPLTYSDEADYQLAWKKVRAVHAAGIRSFALCLDDINTALQPPDQTRFGTLSKCQVHFVNRLWNDLHALDAKARLIFCPSAYCTAEAEKHLDYIKTIGDIDPGVAMFWTGPTVCSATITKDDALKFGAWIRRKPVVWDNYPVNDMYPWRPLLSPIKGRAPDLAEATSGFMSNPMKQWEISRLPLSTVARYVNEPLDYDWRRAGEAAINEWPEPDRPVVRELVDVYGSSFWGEPGFPPKPMPAATEAETVAETSKLVQLRRHLEARPELAAVNADVRPTLDDDIRRLERAVQPGPPLTAPTAKKQ